MSDYSEAKRQGFIMPDRWERNVPHHRMSKRLMSFLEEHDYRDNEDGFCWKTGGDGDNGETLMYQMDAFFEYLEATKGISLSILADPIP